MRWQRFRPPVKSLIRIVQVAALLICVVAASWALGATLFPGPLAFTSDGTSLVGAVNGYPWPAIRDVLHLHGVVKVWDAREGRLLARLPGQPAWIRSVSISPDGSTIAVAGDAPTIELWDLRSRSRRKVLEGQAGRIGRVTFSPDGATLASADWNGEVQLWDVSTGRTRIELMVSSSGETELAFSPDGAELATGDGVAVRLWDTRSAQELRSIDGQNLHFLGFTDAGHNLRRKRARFGETYCYAYEMADHNRGHVDLDLLGNRHRAQISPPTAKASQGNAGLTRASDLPRDHRQHPDCHRVAFE